MSGAPPGKEAAVELTSGQARYLLAVYHLGLGACGVRCADIARMLDVTRPSVVKMLSFFSQRCLIARVPSKLNNHCLHFFVDSKSLKRIVVKPSTY